MQAGPTAPRRFRGSVRLNSGGQSTWDETCRLSRPEPHPAPFHPTSKRRYDNDGAFPTPASLGRASLYSIQRCRREAAGLHRTCDAFVVARLHSKERNSAASIAAAAVEHRIPEYYEQHTPPGARPAKSRYLCLSSRRCLTALMTALSCGAESTIDGAVMWPFLSIE